jgi:O-methyltransferase
MTDISALYDKYKSHTMCNEQVFIANLELALNHAYYPSNTAVVECGTWKGGMVAAMAEVLGDRHLYVLCDSFQGLPETTPIDGPAAKHWELANPKGCHAERADAELAMSLADRVTWTIVPGWFRDTLPLLAKWVPPVAILRLDADWYESTHCALDWLWDRVLPFGLVIIDDYYVWDGCSRAVHEFLVKRNEPDRIRAKSGVAYIVKGSHDR